MTLVDGIDNSVIASTSVDAGSDINSWINLVDLPVHDGYTLGGLEITSGTLDNVTEDATVYIRYTSLDGVSSGQSDYFIGTNDNYLYFTNLNIGDDVDGKADITVTFAKSFGTDNVGVFEFGKDGDEVDNDEIVSNYLTFRDVNITSHELYQVRCYVDGKYISDLIADGCTPVSMFVKLESGESYTVTLNKIDEADVTTTWTLPSESYLNADGRIQINRLNLAPLPSGKANITVTFNDNVTEYNSWEVVEYGGGFTSHNVITFYGRQITFMEDDITSNRYYTFIPYLYGAEVSGSDIYSKLYPVSVLVSVLDDDNNVTKQYFSLVHREDGADDGLNFNYAELYMQNSDIIGIHTSVLMAKPSGSADITVNFAKDFSSGKMYVPYKYYEYINGSIEEKELASGSVVKFTDADISTYEYYGVALSDFSNNLSAAGIHALEYGQVPVSMSIETDNGTLEVPIVDNIIRNTAYSIPYVADGIHINNILLDSLPSGSADVTVQFSEYSNVVFYGDVKVSTPAGEASDVVYDSSSRTVKFSISNALQLYYCNVYLMSGDSDMSYETYLNGYVPVSMSIVTSDKTYEVTISAS